LKYVKSSPKASPASQAAGRIGQAKTGAGDEAQGGDQSSPYFPERGRPDRRRQEDPHPSGEDRSSPARARGAAKANPRAEDLDICGGGDHRIDQEGETDVRDSV